MGDDFNSSEYWKMIHKFGADNPYGFPQFTQESDLELTLNQPQNSRGPDGLPGLPSEEELLRREQNQSSQSTGLPPLGELLNEVEQPSYIEPTLRNVLIPLDREATTTIVDTNRNAVLYPIEVLENTHYHRFTKEELDHIFTTSLVPNFLSIYAQHPHSMFVFCYSSLYELSEMAPAITRNVTVAPRKRTISLSYRNLSQTARDAIEDAVPKR